MGPATKPRVGAQSASQPATEQLRVACRHNRVVVYIYITTTAAAARSQKPRGFDNPRVPKSGATVFGMKLRKTRTEGQGAGGQRLRNRGAQRYFGRDDRQEKLFSSNISSALHDVFKDILK